MSDVVEKVLAGSKRHIARLITQIESRHPDAQATLSALFPHTGKAHLIGVTGAPGTGKSTLVTEIAKAYRAMDRTVAIIAVDPSSPFTGGAILGDRVRMQALAGDAGVYIRSLANRGAVGGLSWAVDDAVKVLDAAGFEVIIIETVGAGQGEVDIIQSAHTVLVVEAPGLGDDVQAIKAGILEIADIFVVNKADRQGAERTVSVLKMNLELGKAPAKQIRHHGQVMDVQAEAPPDEDDSGWKIPVLKTTAIQSEGIAAVIAAIDAHRAHLTESGELEARNRSRLSEALLTILQAELIARLRASLPPDALTQAVARLEARDLTPYEAAQEILAQFDFNKDS